MGSYPYVSSIENLYLVSAEKTAYSVIEKEMAVDLFCKPELALGSRDIRWTGNIKSQSVL